MISLVVEDGTGLPDSNSYVSLDVASVYMAARGYATWASFGSDDTRAAALVRATAFIDATYRGRFPGYPARGRLQALEWPRIGAYTRVADDAGRGDVLLYGAPGVDPYAIYGVSYLEPTEIPREVIAAVCEGALRENMKPGSLAPDLKRGGAIKSVHAGSVSVEWAGGAPATTVFQVIDMALVSLLTLSSPFSGRVSRG